jgi:hypothetical protein
MIHALISSASQWAMSSMARDYVKRGELVPVLEEFSTPSLDSTYTIPSGGTRRRHCARS